MMSIKILKSILHNKMTSFSEWSISLFFSKLSAMLTLKIMSFHFDYVNFRCHREEMSIKNRYMTLK